jgi:segregation and condensation protein B
MSLKAKIEAIIYATEEPVTLDQLGSLLKDAALAEFQAEENARLALNETIYDGRSAAADSADDSPQQEAVSTEPPPSSEQAQLPTANKEQDKDQQKQELREVKSRLSSIIDQLIAEYSASDRGMEIRQVAGGYRMATKPEHHDVVVTFAKSLKPPIRLSLQALETLSVIAYKQPVTVPEISEIRGVDSSGVIATLLDRKLITTAGRKQVIGRPILYKTTKEFLLRFGLNDVSELPSMEEFEKLGEPQAELFPAAKTQAEAPLPESGSVDETQP